MYALSTLARRAVATRVTLIPGDGIGPEVMNKTKALIKATGAPVAFDTHPISEIAGYDGDDMDAVIDSCKHNRVALKGFLLAGRSQSADKMSLQMRLNRELDSYAHVAHVHSYDGVNTTKHKNIDFIVIRETTEGEYCGEEHEAVEGVVESLKVTTLAKCERIAHFAFDYAMKHNRKKVTCVHKANIMKKGDGLFMRTCTEVAKQYPRIEFEPMIVDNTCMQLVSNPWQFDVMVTPNLYGNIIENLGAGLIGGAGVLPGAHYSGDVAFFGPGARYTFMSGAGKDIANPTAMFMSAGNLLAHIGYKNHGDSIKKAVRKVIRNGKCRTKDLGGQDSLSDFTNAVLTNMKRVDGPVAPLGNIVGKK